MEIVVGGDAVVGLTPSAVLSATLDKGRLQERSTAGDILKVVTAEGEVRGRGDVVVTRSAEAGETRVSSLRGWFRVRSPRGMVSLDAGQGTIVRRGEEAEILDLPAAPTGITPGTDPPYIPLGRTARLSWRGTAPRYHVEVLDLAGREVVLSREVEGTSVDVPARELGTFQWRVSSVDARGLEGLASPHGLFCVVEK
jgi:hypothetical protein